MRMHVDESDIGITSFIIARDLGLTKTCSIVTSLCCVCDGPCEGRNIPYR